MLGDMGADVVRIDRPSSESIEGDPLTNINARSRRSVALNLKTDAGRDAALRLISQADVLIEGFRPGVMERLGLGPEEGLAKNPKLVYGRMTGWGQDGPLANAAGHDINYLAITGALHAIGPKEAPIPPLNIIDPFFPPSLPPSLEAPLLLPPTMLKIAWASVVEKYWFIGDVEINTT